MITEKAKARCAAKSLKEQLEDCRRQMQCESGAGDMVEVNQHLNVDNWQTRCQQVMRIESCD